MLLYCSSSKADINCATDVVGLCTPTTETIITEVVTEESYSEGDGITTIITTNTRKLSGVPPTPRTAAASPH